MYVIYEFGECEGDPTKGTSGRTEVVDITLDICIHLWLCAEHLSRN